MRAAGEGIGAGGMLLARGRRPRAADGHPSIPVRVILTARP
ncbi:hypothetical protein [Streptomyces sp. NPDC005423]